MDRNKEHLERFYITTWNIHTFLEEFLNPAYIPTRLRYLRIPLPLDMIKYFVSSLQSFALLDELSIHLMNSHWPDSVWPVHPPPQSTTKPLLQKIAINDDTSHQSRPHLRKLVRYLTRYPAIQNCNALTLQLRGYYVELSLVTPLLQSMPTLRELRVYLQQVDGGVYLEESDLVPDVVVLPKVERLISDTIDCLRFIRMPNLKDLNIREPKASEDPFPADVSFGGSLEKLKIDWGSLEKMADIEVEKQEQEGEGEMVLTNTINKLDEIARQSVITELIWRTWEEKCEPFTAALNWLTTITLPSRETSRNTYRKNPFNGLCFALINSKDACPSLQTINSRMFPLWDLLFTVLRFRCQTPGVKPITTISIPCLPRGPILRRLVNLLKGEIGTGEGGEVSYDLWVKHFDEE